MPGARRPRANSHSIIEVVDEENRQGVCAVCGPVKLYRNKAYKGNPNWRCSTMSLRHAREQIERDPDCHREARFKRVFGITIEKYDEMLAAQDGVCARCKQPPGEMRLAVDHDHDTGEVRSLLCGACNTYLGRLEANVQYLEWDLSYLDAAAKIAERLEQVAARSTT